ncbi:MAG: rhodanese-like domain-containing protein [Pseudomonadota bacterium]
MVEFLQFVSQEWLMVSIMMAFVFMLVMHETRRGGAALSPAELTALVNNEEGLVLDVRDSKDYAEGHIVGAINIPHAKVSAQLTQIDKHKQKPVIVVCRFGQHAGMVSKILKASGFENVSKLSGGMAEWQSSQMPVVKA